MGAAPLKAAPGAEEGLLNVSAGNGLNPLQNKVFKVSCYIGATRMKGR